MTGAALLSVVFLCHLAAALSFLIEKQWPLAAMNLGFSASDAAMVWMAINR